MASKQKHSIEVLVEQWAKEQPKGIKRNKHANGKLLLGEVILQMPVKIAV